MSYGHGCSSCGSGCGSGCYSSGSGLDRIVKYANASTSNMYTRDYSHSLTSSISAVPDYSDSMKPSGFDYIINLDAHKPEVISSGGGAGIRSNYGNNDNYGHSKVEISENYNNSKPTTNGPTIINSFINPWVQTRFIGEVGEIRNYIEQAFEVVTGKKMPNDFTIELCDENRLKKMHIDFGGTWSPGIQGFAINRKHIGGQNHIFIKKGDLANVMIVIGHELGHIMSTTLLNKHDEEAKAYAFELAWLKALKDNNIAELGEAINLGKPAENGLHDVSFKFVSELLQQGMSAIDIFWRLISGDISYAMQGYL